MKKIKILFVIPRFSVGGAEKFIVHSFPALNRDTFAPSLITIFREKKDSCANEVHIDHCFQFRSTWDIAAFIRLYAYMKREKFDVVVTHLFVANLLARIAAIIAGVPVIVSYEHNIYPNKRYWQIVMDFLLAKKTNRIIVDSNAASAFTAQQESIPIGKFTTLFIPPLLDERPRRSPEMLRKELGIEDDAPVVLCVSRLVVDKGHLYLVEAAPVIFARHPRAHILIGGWGPLQESLESQVQALGLGKRVRLLGRVDGQEFLNLADVYVDPSISTDLPIGIMEAMREGKAIVATEVGDIPAFVQNNETGITVPPADPESLGAAISKLLDDASLRARFGEAATKRVAKYSLDAYMTAFEKLIVDLYGTRTH